MQFHSMFGGGKTIHFRESFEDFENGQSCPQPEFHQIRILNPKPQFRNPKP